MSNNYPNPTPETEQNSERLLSKQEVAQFLSLTGRTIDNLMKRGLPHYKIGCRRTRFCKADVRRWLEENCKAAA